MGGSTRSRYGEPGEVAPAVVSSRRCGWGRGLERVRWATYIQDPEGEGVGSGPRLAWLGTSGQRRWPACAPGATRHARSTRWPSQGATGPLAKVKGPARFALHARFAGDAFHAAPWHSCKADHARSLVLVSSAREWSHSDCGWTNPSHGVHGCH